MRKLITFYFLLFIFNNIYSQEKIDKIISKKDTITLGINDIERTRNSYASSIGVSYSGYYYIVKETKKKLNGFYKIIINDDQTTSITIDTNPLQIRYKNKYIFVAAEQKDKLQAFIERNNIS